MPRIVKLTQKQECELARVSEVSLQTPQDRVNKKKKFLWNIKKNPFIFWCIILYLSVRSDEARLKTKN